MKNRWWKEISFNTFTNWFAIVCDCTKVRTQSQPCVTWIVIQRHCERSRREPMFTQRKASTIVEIQNIDVVGKDILQTLLTSSRKEVLPHHLRQRRRKPPQRWSNSDPVQNRCPRRLRRLQTEPVRLMSNQPRLLKVFGNFKLLRTLSVSFKSPQNATKKPDEPPTETTT